MITRCAALQDDGAGRKAGLTAASLELDACPLQAAAHAPLAANNQKLGLVEGLLEACPSIPFFPPSLHYL